jgi:hypothetical protein
MAQTNANLIWKIADLLRGPYQPNQKLLGELVPIIYNELKVTGVAGTAPRSVGYPGSNVW